MENDSILLLVSTAAALAVTLWYAKKSASLTASEHLSSNDYNQLVECVNHVKNGNYKLAAMSDMPTNLGTLSVFTREQIEMLAAVYLQSKPDFKLMSLVERQDLLLEYFFAVRIVAQDGKIIMPPGVLEVISAQAAARPKWVDDPSWVTWYQRDCQYTDLISHINNEWYCPSLIETGCTLAALGLGVYFIVNPSILLNTIGFGANSPLWKLSLSDYSSTAKLTDPMNPVPLGGLLTVALTGITGAAYTSVLSQGLVRFEQAQMVAAKGQCKPLFLWPYNFLPDYDTPRVPFIQDDTSWLKSKSFGSSTLLTLGGFGMLHGLSNFLADGKVKS